MSDDSPDLQGKVDASGLRIAIVVSRFNQKITDRLLDGALEALTSHGADAKAIEVVTVPGALEIGTVAARLIEKRELDVLICLGCVIQGGTAHFEHVCRGAMEAICNIASRGDIAVGNGLLTVDTIVQAEERAGGSHGHKGFEAALVAVEVAQILKSIA